MSKVGHGGSFSVNLMQEMDDEMQSVHVYRRCLQFTISDLFYNPSVMKKVEKFCTGEKSGTSWENSKSKEILTLVESFVFLLCSYS